MPLLKDYPYDDGIGVPKELLDDIIYYFQLYENADTPAKQAGYLIQLSDKISDLKTWLPSYEVNTGTVDWEREDEENA